MFICHILTICYGQKAAQCFKMVSIWGNDMLFIFQYTKIIGHPIKPIVDNTVQTDVCIGVRKEMTQNSNKWIFWTRKFHYDGNVLLLKNLPKPYITSWPIKEYAKPGHR